MNKQVSIPSAQAESRENDLLQQYINATHCSVSTPQDRMYFTAIAFVCLGLMFPPLFIGAAVCVYKAKKGGRV